MIFTIVLILIILLVLRRQKILTFNSLSVVSFLYLICFGLVPIIFFSFEIPPMYDKGWLRYLTVSSKDDRIILETCFYSLMGYLLFLIGYKLTSFRAKNLIVFRDNQLKLLIKLSIIIFLVGLISFLTYLWSLGGILDAFLLNNRMLFNEDKVEVESSVSFLKQFSKIILTATYFLWAMMEITKSKKVKILFYISLAVSFSYLFYSSGRLSLITFIFTFLLAKAILNNKIPKKKLVLLISVAGFLTLFGKSLFRIFIYEDALDRSFDRISSGDSMMTPVWDFVGEFSFPFFSFVRNIDINSNWLFFKDLLFSFTYMLPARLFPIVENTSLQNTKNLFGNSIEVAGVPSDILSYGYLNFGFIGVILMTIIFGILCKWVDSFRIRNNNPLSIIFLISIVFTIGFGVMYFDPKHLLKGSFYLYSVLFLILFVLKIKRNYTS